MKKYKIGYTTGVFDLFHIGHLNVLQKAKEQCEYLIVGVSTDELVLQYKNKIPVIPYDARVKIVEAIKYVDKVVPQDDMDKYVAWKKHKFNVIFHGDDWKDSSMYQEIEGKLKKEGVDFVYFPYTKSTSSTVIRKKLEK